MLKESYPYYLANHPCQANTDLKVKDKFTGEVATHTALADDQSIDEAIGKAVTAVKPLRAMAAYERQAVLQHCVNRFEERKEELAVALCIEAGKPIKDSRGEVSRLIDTFRIAAEESIRIMGEVMPMDICAKAKGYTGMWKRIPIGPCSFISPFNFPLNLAAHKVAPAIAAGCPFVLKPASLTPIGALIIGEILAETNLPPGTFSILPCKRDAAERFTTDERLKLLSFTGSPAVGWDLKRKAGKKKVVLELGGNAAVIVDEDTDIDDAIKKIVVGAYYQSGQSCVSVQRILIHKKIYDAFRDKMAEKVEKLKSGNPREEDTFIGPMISEKEACRVESWIQSAEKNGAKIITGGSRKGNMVEATLMENVPKNENLNCKEIFGPVAILNQFSEFDEALNAVNDSPYGLQAGIFTRDIYKAHKAWDELEVGGVLIGDVPSWRVDHMPYGGVKDSGMGREGIRWAIEDMTEIHLMILASSS